MGYRVERIKGLGWVVVSIETGNPAYGPFNTRQAAEDTAAELNGEQREAEGVRRSA